MCERRMRQAQADESVQNSALGQLAPNREQACGITKHLRNSSTTARFPCLQMHYSRYEALNLSVACHHVLQRLLQLGFELNWMRSSVAGQGRQA